MLTHVYVFAEYVCVCMCVCMYKLCVRVHMSVYTCVWMHICVCVCVHACLVCLLLSSDHLCRSVLQSAWPAETGERADQTDSTPLPLVCRC